MGCGSGGCASGGCGFKGGSTLGAGAPAGCGSGGCSSGSNGAGTWDGTYRDVVGIKIGNQARTSYFDSTAFQFMKGDLCVVEGDPGEAFGAVVQPTGPSRRFVGVPMKKVLRRATAEDLLADQRNQTTRRELLEYCRPRLKELNLEMKLVEVEPTFDGRRITCYFTAEERVDFRELVRDLAQKFRRRIEMRQIGARDEAKILGGYGICGRPLCCSTFLTEFAPISVKMAKRQGLSLNPSKISGLCGRLMCCLRYEDQEPPKGASRAPEVAEEPSGPPGDDPAQSPSA